MAHRLETMTLRDVLALLPDLIRNQAFGAARLNLEHGFRAAKRMLDFQALLEQTRQVPQAVLLEDDAWAVLMARLLSRTRQVQALLDLSELVLQRFPVSVVLAHRAWALLQTQQYEASLELSERCVHLGLEVGLARRLRAEAMAGLGQTGWRDAFALARQSLEGRALGLCLLEEGYWLARHGDEVAALHCFSAALPRFDDDAYYRAWLNYNLGLLCLRDWRSETEGFFLQLQLDANHAEAKGFQARAFCGLGAARRAYGEWDRAATAYRQASKLAREDNDKRQAWRGLGFTQRLQGHHANAFANLKRALDVPGSTWVHVDFAALHAQLGQFPKARTHLELAGELNGEDQDRASIVMAALEQHDGDPQAARARLQTLPRDRLWVREEQTCFPALFALLEPESRPAPLPRADRTRIEIQACGVLRVTVNGRAIPIRPSGQTAKLLVLLLEGSDRAQSTAYLTDKLYGQDARKNQATLSSLVRALKTLLGWACIQTLNKAYRLDTTAEWCYDAQERRARGERIERFLEGADAAWIDDIRRHGQILN